MFARVTAKSTVGLFTDSGNEDALPSQTYSLGPHTVVGNH